MTKATKSEAPSVAIRVSGRNDMKSPTTPGQKRSGTNGAMVVMVEANTGMATSAVPSFAACAGLFPYSCWWR